MKMRKFVKEYWGVAVFYAVVIIGTLWLCA